MLNKIKQISTFLIISIVSMAVYGVILYFVFIWLSGYSLLHAYIGNLVLIVSTLAIDEYMQKMLLSENFIKRIRKDKDLEKTFRTIKQGIASVGSFKTDIYLFYILILVFSQITEFNPALAGERLTGFIHANDYSILFLIAFDTFVTQFVKDKAKMKNISEKLEESMRENQKDMNNRKLCLCVGDISLYFASLDDMKLVYDMMHEDEEIKNILFYGAGEDWKWEKFQQTESKWFPGDESKNAYYLIERGGEIIGWISHSYNNAKIENMEIDISFNSLSHTGKGLGTMIIKTLTDYTHEKYGINTFMIRPGKHNKRAIRAYEKSGFKAVALFDPNDYYTAEDVVLWGDGDLGVEGTFNMIKTYKAKVDLEALL